jgi:DNA-directed RNA polymerase subunit beta
MQRQAVPLMITEVPLVVTGLEKFIAYNSEKVLKSPVDGYINYVDSERIIIGDQKLPDDGEGNVLDRARAQSGYREIILQKFVGLNGNTCQNQRPVIKFGQKIKKGAILADGAATSHGELALGKNLLVGSWSHKLAPVGS